MTLADMTTADRAGALQGAGRSHVEGQGDGVAADGVGVASRPPACRHGLPAGCANFLYVFKAARNGPHAPPPGRASDAPPSLHAGHATRPASGAESGKPGGRRRR